jgi:hypothetical protein
MRKVLIPLFFILIICCGLSVSCKKHSKQKILGPAGTTVKIFCELDGLGIRTSSEGWKYTKVLVNWEEEPGWDILSVFDKYEIVKEQYQTNKAIVEVKYHIIGKYSGERLKKANINELIVYKLLLIDGSWKIDVEKPEMMPPPPHINNIAFSEIFNKRP